jgi:hypothetical protein
VILVTEFEIMNIGLKKIILGNSSKYGFGISTV